VKRYPGGPVLGSPGRIHRAGDELRFTGPLRRAFTCAMTERDPDGGGRVGMAPVLSLLRKRVDRSGRWCGSSMARTEADLFYLDVIEDSGQAWPDFEFTPVVGFVHEGYERVPGVGVDQDSRPACEAAPMIDAMTEL
jgi:ferredoxin-NADP reductase